MNLVDWSESLSVKVELFDNQHKELLFIINELHIALIDGKSSKIMSSLLQDLVHYTQTHFSEEEAYFDKLEYPGADEHKRQHQEFVKKVMGFNNDYLNGKSTLSLDVMEYLVNWFMQHIQRTDQEYVQIANK